jgi:predicted nucleic acid-binding protein
MIIYLDTRALVKRYFSEKHSESVVALWRKAEEIITSSVAYAEAMASFWRKKREGRLTSKCLKITMDLFRRDWESFIRVEVNKELNPYIDMLVEKYTLRGFDAIHLASATIVSETVPEDLLFICFDKMLVTSAQKQGLKTFPPK